MVQSGVLAQDPFLQIHIEDTRFCRIATNIQDRLAMSPCVEFTDMAMLDAELEAWYANLRIRAPEPYSLPLLTARAILNWRYYNLRIILHRPVLLSVAMRSALPDTHSRILSPDEISAVVKCRIAASKAIEDIAMNWQPNQLSGWNGTWFLYQACIIPLVSIFMDPTNAEIEQWRHQVEISLDLFDRLVDWSLAARRTKEVVVRVYEASKASSAPAIMPGMDVMNGQGDWDNINGVNFWDDMMWETFPDNLDLSLNGLADVDDFAAGDMLGYFLGDNARSDYP